VKDVYITVFNRFSFTQDVYSEPSVANQAQVPRFENTVGTQVSWIPDKFVVAGGYSYQISFSDSEGFNYLNRNSHLLFGRAGYLFGEGAASSGLEVSATLTDYEQNLNSDTTVLSLGPYLDWRLTESINLRLRGGYVMYSYQTVLAPEQANDQSSFYLGLSVDQRLTEHIRHGVAITQGVRPGVERTSAFVLETGIGYSISWAFIDPASLRLGVNYTHGEQSASAPLTLSEVYDQYRVGVGVSWNPIGRLTLNAGYDCYIRESDVAGRSYTVNRVMLGAGYTF
jgi:opacity protein-like surface antigen